LTISCRGFRPLCRNTLRDFAEIRIDELCLTIRDIAVHERNGSRWAQLPSRPLLRDGELVHDADGKTQYALLMHFDSRAVSDAFSSAVIRALLEFAPSALEPEEL